MLCGGSQLLHAPLPPVKSQLAELLDVSLDVRQGVASAARHSGHDDRTAGCVGMRRAILEAFGGGMAHTKADCVAFVGGSLFAMQAEESRDAASTTSLQTKVEDAFRYVADLSDVSVLSACWWCREFSEDSKGEDLL